MKSLIALIALSVSSLGLATQAQSGNAANEPTITVKYSARELNSERGVAMLYARIEVTAERLCEHYNPGYDHCVASTLLRAIAAIDRPELDAYAAARGVLVGSLSATHGRR